MFKYVQWVVFLLIFVPSVFLGNANDGLGVKLVLGFVLASVGTFIATLFLRPVWNMFAGMFGGQD